MCLVPSEVRRTDLELELVTVMNHCAGPGQRPPEQQALLTTGPSLHPPPLFVLRSLTESELRIWLDEAIMIVQQPSL